MTGNPKKDHDEKETFKLGVRVGPEKSGKRRVQAEETG